jgi:hypothetical protein
VWPPASACRESTSHRTSASTAFRQPLRDQLMVVSNHLPGKGSTCRGGEMGVCWGSPGDRKTTGSIANGLFDGTMHRVRSDSRPCHRPAGSATQCDGLEDLPCTRTFGIARRLAPELPGKTGDTLQGQASSGAAWLGSLSKRHMHFFKELFPLRTRKTNDQPSEARQQSISVGRLQAHSRQKVRTDHLQTVASRLVAP